MGQEAPSVERGNSQQGARRPDGRRLHFFVGTVQNVLDKSAGFEVTKVSLTETLGA